MSNFTDAQVVDSVRQLLETIADPVMNEEGFEAAYLQINYHPEDRSRFSVLAFDSRGKLYKYAIYGDEHGTVADGS